MSILSSRSQGSVSSSPPTPSRIPNSEHGKHRHSQSPPSLSGHIGSLQISDPQSPVANQASGASASAESGGSSKKVIESGIPNGKKALPYRSSDTIQRQAGGQRVGSSQAKGEISGAMISPQSQQGTRSSNSHGSTAHSTGRRTQMTNGNHLLNFQYDPITRPQFRPPPPPRRKQKIKPYNKDLFLQANYKFVVLDTGNYGPESIDPDKMLQWEDIICVRYSTPFAVQCPICLEYPLCPQITSCGHIFCFPCILQYLLMGEEDHKGDCFKRCPLCFVMVSPKDLYTIYIENVKQYCVGDIMDFMLLTRQKDSFTSSTKRNLETDTLSCSDDEVYDPFVKFTFTSDVELSVRKGMLDLDDWLARAESGLVDDLEKLPFVCAAIKQLELRKKYWNEQSSFESKSSCKNPDCQKGPQGLQATLSISSSDCEVIDTGCATLPSCTNDQSKRINNIMAMDMSDGGTGLVETADMGEAFEVDDSDFSSSYGENNCLPRHSSGCRDANDRDSYNFYQAVDGQHVILHPLNLKCLLHYYGSYDMLPHRISGKILQMETVTQTEATRRRYRYLSHFSLTTTFQLCEIDLTMSLPPDAMVPFMEEIKKRKRQRKQLAEKERREKMKAEATAAESVPYFSSAGHTYCHDDFPTFSMDDFEALGRSGTISSSPPVVAERRLFSSVAKLGFAAGYDSPSLKIDETDAPHNNEVANNSSGVTDSRTPGTASFANITSKGKAVENVDAPKIETGKKGKKPSRVLLSTSGGRRY
ncbi:RING finger protein 10-like [Tripterygium wilfordii]|uniref:RING finger protein 10-like n=1 Tax=Tripterygium wilfordii TaxID=458696 RepID=A0A7J7BVD9_TRIWF|nr:RING finger protein 10 isoform X2 [Tripterygium wilfordii]KAF5725587.1 RING finger protein 10-like [Tripterygium wilfordii]